ncbi:MAG: 4,5-dihydroxyphthalate decarboxylase [Pseudomonadota bacterium]|jgi:4,5-dihydroxyphthalate decarboxylase
MARPPIRFAISHYDRYVPFLDGTVTLEAFDLQVLQVGQSVDGRYGKNRHSRMLNGNEFDVAEVSLSSYLMARARGLPFTAIPVFPRRLFSPSQIWIRDGGRVKSPTDLIGKRVGLSTFQTTLSLLAKGDLQTEYGVPWREIEWVTNRPETVAFTPESGVRITQLPESKNLSALLLAGEIDAIFRPHPPDAYLKGDKSIRRLFDDPKAEETRYFRKNGFYPIMHITVFRDEVLQRHPELCAVMMEACARADEISLRYYDDPNWSRLAWGRHFLEEERMLLGANPWPIGIEANRACLERFIGYSHDQGLIAAPISVESLFA